MSGAGEPISAFSARAGQVISLVVIVSLLGAFVVGIFGRSPAPDSWGSDAYSESAAGHRAFVGVLNRLGYRVVVNRDLGSVTRFGDDALHVLIEPTVYVGLDTERPERLRELLAGGGGAVLVLPKRVAVPEADGVTIREAPLVLLEDVGAVLVFAELEGTVTRELRPASTTWTTNELGAVPTLEVAQLIVCSTCDVLLGGPDGALVVSWPRPDGGVVVVVSDPDVLLNATIGEGDNAVVAARAVHLAARQAAGRAANPDAPTARNGGTSNGGTGGGGAGGGPVVIDATLHGFAEQPSFARTLTRFPLVLITTQTLLAVGLLLWMAAGRFGSPLPAAPELARGYDALLALSSRVLTAARTPGAALRSYRDLLVRDALERSHAPWTLDDPEATRWLKETGQRRGVRDDIDELDAAVRRLAASPATGQGAEQAAVHVARRLHAWHEDMTR